MSQVKSEILWILGTNARQQFGTWYLCFGFCFLKFGILVRLSILTWESEKRKSPLIQLRL